jgi:hypothetical protein
MVAKSFPMNASKAGPDEDNTSNETRFTERKVTIICADFETFMDCVTATLTNIPDPAECFNEIEVPAIQELAAEKVEPTYPLRDVRREPKFGPKQND